MGDIYDYDHLYSQTEGVNQKEYIYDEVSIGSKCWIGANTVILLRTTIGDNCLIGSGCVLKGNCLADSVFVQKRETKFIQRKQEVRWKINTV